MAGLVAVDAALVATDLAVAAESALEYFIQSNVTMTLQRR
jgi:hypothetical protein